MTTRESYAATFGKTQADRLQEAGESHRERLIEGDKRGSDPFRDAIVIAIGHECFTEPSYRKYHGITPSVRRIKAWIRDHGELAGYDGPIDYIALAAGAYEEYMPTPEKAWLH